MPSIRREAMPDFSPSEIEIRVFYPGAGAEEVEEAVCLRLEDALDGIEYVHKIRSDAREGVATVTVKMEENGRFQTFLSDIEKAVDAIEDFPDEVEAIALQLRGMNMLFEGLKEKGSLIIVPSSALESMNLGVIGGLAALSDQNADSTRRKAAKPGN